MKKKTMGYKAKSARGFVVTIKRNSDDKIGICEAGGTKSFYFASNKSAEIIARQILKEVEK